MRLNLLPAAAMLAFVSGCGSSNESLALPPTMPEIVARSIEFHGGSLYEHSTMAMTISSLSGSFRIETTRRGGQFNHTVIGTMGGDVERRVRVDNDGVQESHGGNEVVLDENGTRIARAFVDARVFFPLLPYSLNGSAVQFEDLGQDTWSGRDLHKVKVSFTPESSNDADDHYMFWFDPETGRMEQFGYDFDGGLRLRKGVEFERVGGVLFSTQENYAIDGERIPVDLLSEDYVAENMRLLSTVVISDVTVEPR